MIGSVIKKSCGTQGMIDLPGELIDLIFEELSIDHVDMIATLMLVSQGTRHTLKPNRFRELTIAESHRGPNKGIFMTSRNLQTMTTYIAWCTEMHLNPDFHHLIKNLSISECPDFHNLAKVLQKYSINLDSFTIDFQDGVTGMLNATFH